MTPKVDTWIDDDDRYLKWLLLIASGEVPDPSVISTADWDFIVAYEVSQNIRNPLHKAKPPLI